MHVNEKWRTSLFLLILCPRPSHRFGEIRFGDFQGRQLRAHLFCAVGLEWLKDDAVVLLADIEILHVREVLNDALGQGDLVLDGFLGEPGITVKQGSWEILPTQGSARKGRLAGRSKGLTAGNRSNSSLTNGHTPPLAPLRCNAITQA